MAADEEPVPRLDDDPSTAADALSLHTIADVDAYASQEQEDADFALALALEEQESERYARTQRILQSQDLNQANAPPQAPVPVEAQDETPPPPYSDDPDAVEVDGNLPPYRDDPDAVPAEGEADEAATEPVKRQHAIVRILRRLGKVWLCCLMISTFVTIAILVVAVILVFVYGKKLDPSKPSKEAAWFASGSSDYDLKLPKLYPALEAGTTDTCQNTWTQHGLGLSCHRMLLSSAWDNGDADEVKAEEADPYFYSQAVCTPKCLTSLARMAEPLAKSCTNRTDRFNFASYGNDGRAYFQKGKIEEGPAHVVKNLLERYDRFCQRPKRGVSRDKTEYGTCAADLWMQWGIVDGKNEAHLKGLDAFLEQTSVRKTIRGGLRRVSLLLPNGVNRTSSIHEPQLSVGPEENATECGWCTLNWLDRKMRSFEFGQILDPATGEALGLSEFRDKLRKAILRCRHNDARGVMARVDKKWEELGWWCGDKPCNLDKPEFSNETKAILHGLPREALLEDRENLEKLKKEGAPEVVLRAGQTLLDGLTDMPCYVGFDPVMAKREIIPSEHIVGRLCSDQCRNALDRFIQQHGDLFREAARNREYGRMFAWPFEVAKQLDRVCLSASPGAALQPSENLCAPGYAALGWPEWIFAGTYGGYPDPPIRAQILDVFSKSIDELAARLSKHTLNCRRGDFDCARTRAKIIAESPCNTCAGKIFIGSEGSWKATTDEFLNDKDINGTEYVAAAKKGWRTCAKMHGLRFSEAKWKGMWRERGLDVYD
ncbi:uncharacterized protein N0V89_009024 [Didymosphaeria variabile]|uniref:Uncharacterized protein n=1 Tax=Didymosphaeria variabile TaxID=1932322 RepID=A0A9W8XHD1_9PLEO|nr:uncharacterized protein N0V89_009024 [Didymosphaeria variabile]KAJ4350403.1 hypothetical protein N0V89_009024 [Didymosphaeria variabile]